MIAYLTSFTALAQSSDSTYCFTQDQVKTFLRTKAELDQALETNINLVVRIEELEENNQELATDLQTTEKKLKRTRRYAIGSTLVGILAGVLFVIK